MRLPENRVKIRSGQIWRKKDSGMVVAIAASCGDDRFSYRTLGDNKKSKGHRVMANDLYRFWEKLN